MARSPAPRPPTLVSPRILLVRHGRSAHVHTGRIDHAGLHRWRTAYDAAGIADGDVPPPALRALAQRDAVVVASDLRRARASAALLTPGVDVVTSPLLREAELAVPRWRGPRLPLAAWALAIGVRWIVGALRGERPAAALLRRAEEAAAWLAGLTGERDTVVVVTHAAFRRHLARALCADGWRHGRGWRRHHNWSAWELTRGSGTTARRAG